MKKIHFSVLTLLMLSQSNAQVYDVGTWAQVTDISNDGVAVGNAAGVLHFKWTKEEGPIVIGEIGGNNDYIAGNTTISADGKIVSGTMTNPVTGIDEMALYDTTTQKWEYLGASENGSDTSSWGMSSDGKTIVGLGWKSASQAIELFGIEQME
ncbi:hypothetical protein [Empedobacter falsenii]|uniref:hypothetical protein n=1 Tax=Empedobacter falsenii TaxID=343874 RepID=UPI001C8EDA47|nr:hypothetical protein [Empedobacter falsenii]MBY0067067.1 hypothetical protein [Empedobacter falsenii]